MTKRYFLFILFVILSSCLVFGQKEINNNTKNINLQQNKPGYLNNIIQPLTPTLDSVSINLSGHSILGWEKNEESNVIGYIIYHYENGKWPAIDTINDRNITSYIDNNNDASSISNSYSIASFDSDETSPIGISPEHLLLPDSPDGYLNTIVLNVNFNICKNNIKLTWNKYVNMYANTPPYSESLKGYKIFRKIKTSNSDFQLINTTDKNTTEYIDYDINIGKEYSYFVQAYDSLNYKTSSSCIKSTATHPLLQPKYIYLHYATIKNNDNIELKWYADTSAPISKYEILRSENDYDYKTIGTVIDTINYSPENFYDDNTALFNKKSYYYKVAVFDSCEAQVLISNIAKTIYLSIKVKEGNINYLEWNDYEDWLGFVDSYDVYRKIVGKTNPVLLYNIPYGINYFSDDVSYYINTGGKFSYYIVALEGNGNPYGFADSSKSNEVMTLQTSKIYIPNAFSPKGINKKFKPFCIFIDNMDYLFTIYNKWGQKLFETHNKDEGWDGKYKGKFVPVDVYVYYIKYKNSEGDYFEKRGTVTLIR